MFELYFLLFTLSLSRSLSLSLLHAAHILHLFLPAVHVTIVMRTAARAAAFQLRTAQKVRRRHGVWGQGQGHRAEPPQHTHINKETNTLFSTTTLITTSAHTHSHTRAHISRHTHSSPPPPQIMLPARPHANTPTLATWCERQGWAQMVNNWGHLLGNMSLW